MKPGIDYPGVCVVFYCHDNQGRILMAKRSLQSRDEQGLWDIGGGALDFDEDILKTVAREIYEEYSVQVKDLVFLGYRDVHRTRKDIKTHWVALDFKVLVDSKGAKINEPHKFDAIDWFTLDTLPKNCHSQFPAFLLQHHKKLGMTLEQSKNIVNKIE